jgi:hypothetical protein
VQTEEKPAATSAADSRRPPRRPPTKEEAAKNTETENRFRYTRKGRYVGPIEELPAGKPPRRELYPFNIARRTFPSPGTITVEIAVQNLSGGHWKTAYVAMRADTGQPQMFEIVDWGLDEVVGLDYTFPSNEINERIRNLRVVSVSGEQRESALADLLSRSRQRYVEALTPEEAEMQYASGGTLSAPGLLGILGSLQSPYTGVRVNIVEPRSAPRKPLVIDLPGNLLLPAELPSELTVPAGSDSAKEVQGKVKEFTQQAGMVQDDLRAFLEQLRQSPFEEAMQGGGAASLKQLRETLRKFNASGVELSATVHGSRDPDVRRLTLGNVVTNYSRMIVEQLKFAEQAIRPVDPKFRIQGP